MAVPMSPVLQVHVLSGREASSIPFNELPAMDPSTYPQREAEKPAATEICQTDQPPRQSEPKSVIIPDLFVLFVSQRPKPNPYYEVIKKESEAWMKQYETPHYLPRPQWET